MKKYSPIFIFIFMSASIAGLANANEPGFANIFEWQRSGACGQNPQGFLVCYQMTCQNTCHETIFLIKNGFEKAYPIVDQINDDYRILRTVTLKDTAGQTSEVAIKYYYERATYPGDGEYYPIHLSGSTPDGINFDIDVKGQKF